MADILLASGGNLQTAIDNAALGDRIMCEAGATFSGNFVLRDKLSGSGYITIRTDADDADLPDAGARIDPTYLPFCATVATPNSTEILRSDKAAHHYRFIGIHFPPKGTATPSFGTQLSLGGSFAPSTHTPADALTDIEFDRCVFRGHPASGQKRAIFGGITRFRFVNNYCDRYGATEQSNILALGNGGGDHVIENNFFSGSTQPIIYGGIDQVKTVASVISATNASAVLSTVTDLSVGQRISFLCESNTSRRHPKCLSINVGTGAITFEPLDVVPDIPGDARWGMTEKNITIARNHIMHDPDVVVYGTLMPATGVGTAVIAGNFGAGSPTYRVQGYAQGYYTSQARGAASAATAPVAITQDQGVRVTWTPVANATSHYIYRTLGGIITRFSVGAVGTFDDVGTGGTVVTTVPGATYSAGNVGIELKNGIDVHIHSNIIEWTWKGGFGGEAFTIKCSNQNGPSSFISTENVLIENNVSRHTWGFATVSGTEGANWTWNTAPRAVENLTFRNNLCYDSLAAHVGAGGGGAQSRQFMYISNGAINVHVTHNTSTHQGAGCFYFGPLRGLETGLVIRDNMLRGNTYIATSAPGYGNAALETACGPGGYVFANNALSASPSQTTSHVTGFSNTYVALATWETSFVDATGEDIADYALAVGSPYNNAASDGTDIGCDIAVLEAAVAGVVAGTAGEATPPPNIVTTTLSDVLPGVAYDQTIVASGGTTPYTAWRLVSGALPYGIALEGYGTAVAETNGLLAYWRLNESSGTVAHDHMGGPSGAYTNTPTMGVAGTLTDGDKGVQLNGTDECVIVGNVATLRPSAAVSIEAIIKPANVTGIQNIGGVGGASVGYCLRLSDAEARFIVNGVTASLAGISAATTYHIVGTYDGAQVRVYVNGTSSTPQTLTAAINYGSDVDFVIGNRHGLSAVQYFEGVIEGVSVYNVAIAAATVTAHNTARTAASGNRLVGIPTVEGTYTFEIQVTDSAAQIDAQTLIQIVSSPTTTVPVITTTALPSATVDEAYSATLVATNGTLPYSWLVSIGQLPDGLGLDPDTGFISGTPTESGTFVLTFTVQDAALEAATATLTLIVIGIAETLPVGRHQRFQLQDARVFSRRTTAPTIADLAVSGDVYIDAAAGSLPSAYISTRSGDNLSWHVWPTNDGRVRELAREEAAALRSPGLVMPLINDYAGVTFSPPPAVQEFANTTRARQQVDLSLSTEVMLQVHVLANNSNPSAKLHLKYALTSDATTWDVLHASLFVPINAIGPWYTAWLTLPAEVRTPGIWLRAETVDGATQTLTIVSVMASFR